MAKKNITLKGTPLQDKASTTNTNSNDNPLASKPLSSKVLPIVSDDEFAMPMENLKFVLISIGLIVLGFILMAGGTEDIYSFRRITLSVIVLMSGFVMVIYAIMRKPKDNNIQS